MGLQLDTFGQPGNGSPWRSKIPAANEVILLSDNFVYGELGGPRYMGVYAVAGALESAGFRTAVIDQFVNRPDFFDLLAEVVGSETLVLGISSTFLFPPDTSRRGRAHRTESLDRYYSGELWFERGDDLDLWLKKLKNVIRQKSPNCKLVLGGVKAQFAAWRKSYYQEFDYICFGAGDISLVEFCRELKSQREPKCVEKLGIRLIPPAGDLSAAKICPKTQWQKHWAVQRGEALPLEISRGCAFNCKYCHYEKREANRKSLLELNEELLYNYENFGTTVYHFCDDCFNDTRAKVEQTCEMFLTLPFKLEWVAYSRVDVAVKFPETAKLMVEAGARGLFWGIESFNSTVAKQVGKGTDPEKVKQFLTDFCTRYGDFCLNEASFIVGLPGESESSLSSTLKWLTDNPILDFVSIGPLGLMPYVADLDRLVFDYADYSRQPEKYGFKVVRFNPQYWEHEHMNSTRARELAGAMLKYWREVKKPGFMRTVWLYPHLRTLGFEKNDIFRLVRDPGTAHQSWDEVSGRFAQYSQNYWQSLWRELTYSQVAQALAVSSTWRSTSAIPVRNPPSEV